MLKSQTFIDVFDVFIDEFTILNNLFFLCMCAFGLLENVYLFYIFIINFFLIIVFFIYK